jgi:hypothetical protein
MALALRRGGSRAKPPKDVVLVRYLPAMTTDSARIHKITASRRPQTAALPYPSNSCVSKVETQYPTHSPWSVEEKLRTNDLKIKSADEELAVLKQKMETANFFWAKARRCEKLQGL